MQSRNTLGWTPIRTSRVNSSALSPEIDQKPIFYPTSAPRTKLDSLLSLGSPTNLYFDSFLLFVSDRSTIRILSSHEFPYDISALGWGGPSFARSLSARRTTKCTKLIETLLWGSGTWARLVLPVLARGLIVQVCWAFVQKEGMAYVNLPLLCGAILSKIGEGSYFMVGVAIGFAS